MSQENVEVVRALLARWNAGDRTFADLADYFDPAFELVSPFSSFRGESYRGYAGIERWATDIDEQFAEWSISADEMHRVGNSVLALATISARGRASDVPLRFSSGAVFDFRSDHLLTRLRIYADADEALKAVGLAE